MQINHKVVAMDCEVIELKCFEDICCDAMKSALLSQETPLAEIVPDVYWLWCPYCKEEIIYN